VVRGELGDFWAGLAEKPELIALSKADLLDEKARAKLVKSLEKATGARVFPISAPLEEGMEPLLDAIIERLGQAAEDSEDAPGDFADEGHWSPL
jgi:GTP-binding protein